VSYTVHVSGLREFQRAARKAEGDLDKEIKAELKAIGDKFVPVADQRAAGRFRGPVGPYRAYVQQRALIVRQSRSKVTGLRGDFGVMQMMDVLEPTLEEREPETRSDFEDMLDRLISRSGL
jgi:hypothetical protein